MANTVNVSTLKDSKTLTTNHVYIASDGSSGELTDQVIFDASALDGANNASNIWYIEGCLTGFTARIEVDGSTDGEAVVLPDGQPFCYKFNCSNFPVSQLTGLVGATGDITITTNGFTATGDEGHLVITVKKAT